MIRKSWEKCLLSLEVGKFYQNLICSLYFTILDNFAPPAVNVHEMSPPPRVKGIAYDSEKCTPTYL